jgi:predicted helicase
MSMSHEDVFYEIYQEVHSQGLEERFYNQLNKMKTQDKHKYKCVKDHWEYAYGKITGVQQSHESLFGNTDIK